MQTELDNTTYSTPNYTRNATAPLTPLLSDSLELVSFILSVLGIIANVTAMIATVKVPNGQTAHSKLIISLCVSDGLVLIAIPLKYMLHAFSDFFTDCKNLYKPVLYIALIATQINLLAMALDHYIAIMRPLHHRRLMSNFRGCCIVISIWAFSVTAGLLEFIIGLALKAESDDSKSICTIILIDPYDLEMFIISFIFVVLIIIFVIYTRIYIQLKHQAQIGIPRQQTTKALVTTVLLIGTFTLCWAPMGIYQIYMNLLLKTDVQYMLEHLEELILVNKILLIILQLNSLVDPLIYAIRLPQVRTGFHAVFTSQRCIGKKKLSLPLSPIQDIDDQCIIVVND